MSEDTITSHEENLTVNDPSLNINERDTIDDLILQNKTMDALIKGLTEDIELLKGGADESGRNNASSIVRFSMQLNIMRDKKARNLAAINAIIKAHRKEQEKYE